MLKATKFAPLLLLAVLFGCGEGDGGGGGSAPVINSFSANPATIAAAGQTVQLRWSVSGNPTGLSIDNGVGTVSGNSVNVTPSATTIYTLTATNGSGDDTETTTVTVGGTLPGPGVEDGLPPSGDFGVSLTQTGPFQNDADGNITSASDPRVITVAPGGTFYASVSYTDPGGISAISVRIANSSPAGFGADLTPGAAVNGFTLGAEVTGCVLDGTQTSVTCVYPIAVAAGTPNITSLTPDEFAYVFRTNVTDAAGNRSDSPPRGYVIVGSGGGGTTGGSTTGGSTNGGTTGGSTTGGSTTGGSTTGGSTTGGSTTGGSTSTTGGTTNYTLTVTKLGSGAGTVTANGISCGSDCSGSYASGTPVTLTAVAASDSTFGSWGGACSGTGACQVTMNSAKAVTATFNTTGSQELNAEAGPASKSGTVKTSVPLDGTKSTGATSYNWSLTEKPPTSTVTQINGFTKALASFTPDVEGKYVATLTVGNGTETDPDSITINVSAAALPKPVADAGDDRETTVNVPTPTPLDGTDSINPASFSWDITNKEPNSTPTLATPTASTTTFTADVEGNYVVTLTVRDSSGGQSSKDTVNIKVGP